MRMPRLHRSGPHASDRGDLRLGFTLVAVLVGVGGLGGTEVENSQGGQLSDQG